MLYKCNKCNFSMDYVEGSIISQKCPGCSCGKLSAAKEEKSDILSEASKIINGERQDVYGLPENSFQIIADFWNTYIKHKFKVDINLTSLDIGHLMSLFKISRMLGQKSDRDNYRDAIGYLAICADKLKENANAN